MVNKIIIVLLLLFMSNTQTIASNCSKEQLDAYWLKGYGGKNHDKLREFNLLLDTITNCAFELKAHKHWIAAHIYKAGNFRLLEELDSISTYIERAEKGLDEHQIDEQSYYSYRAEIAYIKAKYYNKKGLYDQALFFYQQCIDNLLTQIGHKKGDVIDPMAIGHYSSFHSFNLFNNIGHAKFNLGDYESALNYFKMSIDVRRKKKWKNSEMLVSLHNECKALFKMGNHEGARLCYDNMLGYFDKAVFDRDLRIVYKNYANLLVASGAYEQAKEILEIATSINEELEFDIYIFQGAGLSYQQMGMPEKAKSNLEITKNIINKLYGSYHPRMARNFQIEGNGLLLENEYAAANKKYNQGLNNLLKKDSDECNCQSMTVSDFMDKQEALDLLEKKAAVLSTLKKHPEAVQCYSKIQELILLMQQKYLISNSSKLLLSKRAKTIYEKAIQTALLADLKEDAYRFSQSSRSMVLLQQINEEYAVLASKVPQKTLKIGRQLKVKIADCKKKIDEKQLKKGLASIGSLEKELISLNKEYDQWRASLEENHPAYYDIKYNFKTLGIKGIQKKLKKENKELIEYFLGKEQLFIFHIGQHNKLEVYEVDLDSLFLKDIHEVQTIISTNKNDFDSYKHFYTSARRLYKTLISKLDIQLDDIIIIPDEELNLIPFEILVSKDIKTNDSTLPQFHNLNYWVRDKNVSYLYSSTLLDPNLSKKSSKKTALNFLGIAPSFDLRNIKALEQTKEEVSSISKKWTGQSELLLDVEATSKKVLDLLPTTKLAHFATHGIFNDEIPLDSRIELADTSLYIYQIYSLQHNLDMAVLSACQTAKGKRRKGEGVISLARAFIQSGCPKVVASLWSVSDNKTSSLMNSFYQKMLGAEANSINSLSAAKRTYLEEATTKHTHPYYWAAMVHIGIDKQRERSMYLHYLIPILALVLGFGFYLLRKRIH